MPTGRFRYASRHGPTRRCTFDLGHAMAIIQWARSWYPLTSFRGRLPSSPSLRGCAASCVAQKSQFHTSSTHVSIILRRAVPRVCTKPTPNRSLCRLLSGQRPVSPEAAIERGSRLPALGRVDLFGESPSLTLRACRPTAARPLCTGAGPCAPLPRGFKSRGRVAWRAHARRGSTPPSF